MSFLEKSLTLVANRMIKDVGHIQKLRLDTRKKSCSADVMLAGETQAVTVDVGRYELVQENGKAMLQLEDVTCSREWMNHLAGRLEPQMRFEVPPALVSVLRLARVF